MIHRYSGKTPEKVLAPYLVHAIRRTGGKDSDDRHAPLRGQIPAGSGTGPCFALNVLISRPSLVSLPPVSKDLRV
jgi:hypothetical protein